MRLFAALLLTVSLSGQFDRARLLSPKTPPRTAPAALADLEKQFANPPAEWRSAPLWVWAEEMDWPTMQRQLASFREQGIGGAFVHPRAGLMTEYLSPQWFDLWKKSLAEARRLGLGLHIYDENSYPSGFAGGHVPAHDPETAGRVVLVRAVRKDERVNWVDADLVAVYAHKENFQSVRRLATFERPREDETGMIVARIEKMPPRPFQANFSYVDLTNPRSTQLFLEFTHEQYKKHLGAEFGKTVRMAFADEPEAPRFQNGVALSFRSLAEFRKRNGYDLADFLPSLYWDTGDFRKIRFDYWQTLHDLLEENYFRAMFEWCDANNLEFTGHWWEHVWPDPSITPADGSMYAYEHIPGIDILWTPELRTRGAQPDLLFAIKQAAGAARQLGRKRVLSEAYGGNGWDATPEYFKLSGDWQIVHGINLINQHYAPTTIYGARKRDWPQHLGEWNAWWPHYNVHAGHTARLALASSAGESRNRVLVMIPTTAAFLLYTPGNAQALDGLKRKYFDLVQSLADAQVDFDLGDEHMVDWYGRVEGNRFRVGQAVYDAVVWPEGIDNTRKGTARALAGFANVIALGQPPRFIDGVPGEMNTAGWKRAASFQELLTLLPARRVRLNAEAQGVGIAERFLSDGSRIIVLASSAPKPWRGELTTEGGAAEIWDTVTGRKSPAAFRKSGANLALDLDLPPAGSLVLAIRQQGQPASAPAESWKPLAASTWQARAEQPNVLVLDYATVKVAGQTIGPVHTTAAADALFRAHGWPMNPWDRTIMFRRSTLETPPAPIGPFSVEYEFTVLDAAAAKGLELVVEDATRYVVELNGSPVRFNPATYWLDRHFLKAPIQARAGVNTITMRAEKFDVRMEIENVYLRGNFSLMPAARGFELAPPRTLALGAWSEAGLPFYGDGVLYSTRAETTAGTLRIELPQWQGSVAEVLIDGKSAGTIQWQPYRLDTPVTSGAHEIAVRVLATPWNWFGPFHYKGDRNAQILWPGHTALNAPATQPAGSAYRVQPYGLLIEPKLFVR